MRSCTVPPAPIDALCVGCRATADGRSARVIDRDDHACERRARRRVGHRAGDLTLGLAEQLRVDLTGCRACASSG
jgi:hypothetical protein